MRPQILYVSGAFLAALVVAGTAPSEEKQTEQELRFVFAGMREARAGLKSGVCKVNGELETTYPAEPERNVSAKQSFFIAFDGSRLRFDSSFPDLVADPATYRREDPNNPDVVTSADYKLGTVVQKFCTDGTKAAFWREGQPFVNVFLDGHWAGGAQRRPRFHFFDVRGLGLYDALEWGREKATLDSLLALWSGATLRSKRSFVDSTDPNTWQIHIAGGDEIADGEWIISVNVKDGFTPTLFQQRERPWGSGDAGWSVVQKFQCQWEQREGIWVPVRQEFWITGPYPKIRRHEWLEIKWQSVNKPVDAGLFEYTSFDVPDWVGVIDNSTGEPITVKEMRRPSTPARSGARRVLAIGLTLLCVALVLLVWLRMRSSSRRLPAGPTA